ncbi:MAG: ricin-type beta-trefoil lectin domain protein [Microcoleus sp. PH2017_01_SCD_O_A]|uniref:ricin-type beta-trefoil lectin domain protein n=1 Tax=unclassified Microcoleus TaxID=2642155 RepID=UPI001E013F9F|nr:MULTISPECIES: ricin-type beta-trefoil lectin domain protein [unclassified Microcoleus]TAF89005.1 MAG: hypothetical protein EAZ49_14725 [Oscillatoriales cyanobacterium]MCC3426319.1 ricin-type beta-trefoil lectin domain protein [Microcoleus sp. PH2017_01_SCD_O_A]MCC3434888.1 ricin-type beta-trefoil lectin domain protein [Microcoleus sp. PH2017_05_CCC_O_A]MCC3447045.1 ricin-type beta-trefoil lectin domain protein [Microcoleus sp. PH2017_09_SFU_O_A]MCC3471304.1 ricin-type beta-trefoil lectin do
MNFQKVQKITAIAIASVSIAFTAQAAQAAETFQVNGGYALNTNKSFRLIDGNPRMSLYQHNINDPDQQFDRLSGSSSNSILLRHGSTGKCLNAHYLSNNAEINVWNCNASDPDQNWNLVNIPSGEFLIRRNGTNLCVDSPTRTNTGRVHLITCDSNNANQRWKSSGSSVSGNIDLPFGRGQSWYVCQGYQGNPTHTNSYALDLTVSNQDFGATACYPSDGRSFSKSANYDVLAPASGTISYVNSDLVCLSIDNSHSLLIGHFNRTVANGQRVNAGQVLGKTSIANSNNGGFSHIHLEARNTAGCRVGTSVPLTSQYGFQLRGVGDLPNLPGGNDYFKRGLTRP